jgi:hypothetical protein
MRNLTSPKMKNIRRALAGALISMNKSLRPVFDAEAMHREIRATCKILETVAKGYPRGSVERAAIRKAADAFIYVRLHERLKRSYQAFQRSCTKPLTKAQKRVLKGAGVT